LSYGGKKEFVSPQIVLETFSKGDKDYVRSIDFIGQKWTDEIHDLGNKIFVNKQNAERKLCHMIGEIERKKEKETV
jgi:hypothetical protein